MSFRPSHTATALASLLPFLLSAAPVAAQETARPPNPPAAGAISSRQATITLLRALERIGSQAGILIVADSTVAYERVPASGASNADVPPLSATGSGTTQAEAAVEKQLQSLLRSLPPGTTWGKLYLPAPAPGRVWRGDDVAAFAFGQTRLFGTIGAPTSDGSIEILGKRLEKDAAARYIADLGLKPVYLVTNPKRPAFAVGMPWASVSPEQWAAFSKEERRQYGQEQAAWIMSLPMEQRQQMLEKIRQHDQYFETVKSPLEKMLGYDL